PRKNPQKKTLELPRPARRRQKYTLHTHTHPPTTTPHQQQKRRSRDVKTRFIDQSAGNSASSSATVSSGFSCRTPTMPARTAAATLLAESSTKTHSPGAQPNRSAVNRYISPAGLAIPSSPDTAHTSNTSVGTPVREWPL